MCLIARVSVILPTYNEKENIEGLIFEILENVEPTSEVIVVDDYSPDGTWRIVGRISSRNPNVKLVVRKEERGLATAVAEGVKNSTGEVIVWMDCDFSQPPALIPRLVGALHECDIALASRYVKGGGMRYSFSRRLTSRLINLFAGFFLGFPIRDYTSGFLAVKREVFGKVRIRSLGGGYGEYFIAFLYDANRSNFKIKEIPYIYLPRKLGLSKTSPSLTNLLKHGFSYCRVVLTLRFVDAKSC